MLLTGNVFAGGIALSGVGSRAIGMGGAFRGLADDYTAVYWNPAGLAFNKNTALSMVFAGIRPTGEFTSQMDITGTDNKGKKYDMEVKNWFLPNLYFAAEGKNNFNYGLGVYVPYALGAEWDIFTLPETMPVDVTGDGVPDTYAPIKWADGFPEKEIKSAVNVIEIHPAASWKINDNFSAGLGFGAMRAEITILKYLPHASKGTYVPTSVDMSGSGWGFGANFGVMYKFSENLQFGLSGKLPSTIKISDIDVNVDTYLNNLVAQSQGLPQEYVVKTKTSGSADMKLPADLGIGIAFSPNSKWLFAADFSWTQWSVFDKIEVELDEALADGRKSIEMNTDWDDAMRFSIGTEYYMNDMLTLRGGYHIEQTPIPDETLNPTWPDISLLHSLNIGSSYKMGKFTVNMNIEHIIFEERKIEEQTAENLKGDYNVNINAFNLSLDYNF